MHSLITHVVEQIFNEGYGDNAEEAATISLVKLKGAITELENLAFKFRGKTITDKRREAVNDPLARVLYYACAIAHLNSIDTEQYDLEDLTEFAESFKPEFQHDALLCCNQMMGHATMIMDLMFENPSTEEVLEMHAAEVEPLTLSDVDVSLVPAGEEGELTPSGEIADDDPVFDVEFDDDDVDHMVACIFAGAILLADKFDTDLGVVIFNASTIEGL